MITEEDIDGLQIANVICAILRIMVIVSVGIGIIVSFIMAWDGEHGFDWDDGWWIPMVCGIASAFVLAIPYAILKILIVIAEKEPEATN